MKTKGEFAMLMTPGKIGTLELKNRIIMPPMSTNFPTVWGEATDVMTDYFKARAKGGAALVFLEVGQTATAIDPLKQLPTSLRFDDDGFLPALGRVVEAVHEGGAKIGAQLSPGFSSQARIGPWIIGNQHVKEVIPVGPSGVIHPELKRPTRKLTIKEIVKITELFGWGALRAKEAGFDIIEIHAHSGFLIGQFLSPYFNRRNDRYGGSPERRFQFLKEIIESTRSHVGSQYPIGIKFSIDEFFEGGRELKEGLEIARRLEKVGVNAITVSSGIHGAKRPSIPSMYAPDCVFMPMAEALKKVIKIPIILPGKIADPLLAENALRDGKADFIGWGRPLIADPDLPRKVAEGRLDEIRRCIHCNECLRVQWSHRAPLRCTVNPVAGREGQFGSMRKADTKKKVLVIGAGPAGMEAARIAGLRGHNVVLHERCKELGGGQLRLAMVPPHKDVLGRIVDYYAFCLKRAGNVQVCLGSEIRAENIITSGADVVIIATGAEGFIPEACGIKNEDNVLTAHQLLAGKMANGEKIVVVGGGSVGCEVANLLAQQGKKVTVIEMLDAVATDIHSMVRVSLLDEMTKYKVKILTSHKFKKLIRDGVSAIKNESQEVKLKADTIVFAVGARSQKQLVKELQGQVKDLRIIGDAKQPGRIKDAISQGFATCYDI